MFFAFPYNVQLPVLQDWLTIKDCAKLNSAVSNDEDKSELYELLDHMLSDLYNHLEQALIKVKKRLEKKRQERVKKRKFVPAVRRFIHVDLTIPGKPVTSYTYKKYLQEVVDLQKDDVTEVKDDGSEMSELTDDWNWVDGAEEDSWAKVDSWMGNVKDLEVEYECVLSVWIGLVNVLRSQ